MPVESGRGTFLYFSTLLGGPVRDAASGRRLGRLCEIASGTQAPFPMATRLFFRTGPLLGPVSVAPWSAVKDVSEGGVKIDGAAAAACEGRPEAGPQELLLECDVLDQQVVDTDGAKVVRVNDIHLFLLGCELYAAHVDVGARGLFRRLGYERLVVGGVRLLTDYRMKENLVSWKHLHLLPSSVEDPHRSTSVKLSVSQGRLNELHPADVADLLEELDAPTRDRIFQSLPVEAAADALAQAQPQVAHEILDSVGEEKAADLLEKMDPGEAADVLGEMPQPDAELLLEAMEPEAAETVRSLLTHEEETAGGLMTTRFLAVDLAWTALRALQEVRRHSGDTEVFNYLYALSQEGTLLGVVALKELFQARPRVTVGKLVTRKLVTVTPATKRVDLQRLFAKYGLRSLPVVDEDGKMMGVVRHRKAFEGMERIA